MIYLKAFTVTWGMRLATHTLQRYTNERIGWSTDPVELFFSNTLFSTDGGWFGRYAARFEVWFVPDSGASERKLMEKVFRIEDFEP